MKLQEISCSPRIHRAYNLIYMNGQSVLADKACQLLRKCCTGYLADLTEAYFWFGLTPKQASNNSSSPKMFCDMCQKILDLDTSYPPAADLKEGPTIPHHKSYSALFQAAHVGCEVCRLLVEKARGVNPEPNSPVLPLELVTFQLSHDNLVFTIPHRIEQDHPESQEDELMAVGAFGEENITLYISTEYNDPLASLFSMRPLSRNSSSDGCYEIVSKWLQDCLETHDECPKLLSPLPSRVIDVGEAEKDPFLYISSGDCKPWLALSHCWGRNQNFVTTSKNINQFSRSIPFADMPETFKDAITITRKLGFQYIWIDSLCIVQDSTEDWEAESPQMAGIYQHATATISADAADGDYQGIFNGITTRRDKFSLHHLPCHSSKRALRGTVIISQPLGMDGYQIIPLQTRAWVLQEKVLSVRNLRYQHSGILWHCQTHESTEIRPTLTQRHLDIREVHKIEVKHLPPRIDCGSGIKYKIDGDAATIQWWYYQVSDYTTRELTYPKDRFAAIAGLAREFAARTGYTYLAGIWAEDLHRGLLWRGEVLDSYRGIGPSWSWAGAVHSSSHARFYNDTILAKYTHTELKVDFEDFSASLAPEADIFLGGGGAASVLTLRGRCKDIEPFMTGKQFYHPLHYVYPASGPLKLHLRSEPFPHTINNMVDTTINFWPDTRYEVMEAASIFTQKKTVVLIISGFEVQEPPTYRPAVTVYALLLEPIGDGSEGTYKRIAVLGIPVKILDWRDEFVMEGFDMRTLRLV